MRATLSTVWFQCMDVGNMVPSQSEHLLHTNTVRVREFCHTYSSMARHSQVEQGRYTLMICSNNEGITNETLKRQEECLKADTVKDINNIN